MFHKRCETRNVVSVCTTFALVWLFVRVVSVSAQTQPESPVANRITELVNPDVRVTLQHNVHPLAQPRFDDGAAPESMSTGRIMLVLKRSDAQEAALRQFLRDVQNPASPSYRKWLTPAQFGQLYGISDSDLATVTAWLQSQGFTIVKVPQARNVVVFSGNFAQVQQAFHTTIHRYNVNGETHYANATDPQIPAALAPVIGGIASLHDFRPKPYAAVKAKGHFDPETHRIKPDLTLHDQQGHNYLFVDPADAATIYDTSVPVLNPKYSGTAYDGTGVTIGIAGVSNLGCGDCSPEDVDTYRSAFLPSSYAIFSPYIIVDGSDPGMIPGAAAIEGLLDNEVAGGVAPGAKINFYIAADTDIQSGLFLAIYRALDDNVVSILNVSFGQCEAFLGTSGNLQVLNAWEQAAAQGISVTVSTGDSGSAGCDNPNTETAAKNGLAVNGLASTPYNIAVGGTDYNVLSSAFSTYVNTSNPASNYYRTALSYIPESPWNDSPTTNSGNYTSNTPAEDSKGNTDIASGGGGISSCTQSTASNNTVLCTANSGYPQPSFQSGIVPVSLFPGGTPSRTVPDVSLLAANGKYGALWVLCADSYLDGSSPQGGGVNAQCANVNGQFTSDATFLGVGGTSAAAPAFAGMLALVSQSQGNARLGQANYVLYNLAGQPSLYGTVFHDIASGNNSVYCTAGSPNCGSNNFITGYNAGAGYDIATGLGSVDVAQVIANWSKAKFTSSTTTLQIGTNSTGLSASPNINVQHGTLLYFNVGVNPAQATGDVVISPTETDFGTPDGTPYAREVYFTSDNQSFLPLVNGTATGSSTALPSGSYAVIARYGGNSVYAPSTSNYINVTISPESSTTLFNVHIYDPSTGFPYTGASNSIPYGYFNFADARPVCSSCIATGGKITPDGVATGDIYFFESGNMFFHTGIGSNGIATLTNYQNPGQSFSVGSHNITAQYTGDQSFNASTSSPLTFTIVPANTTTTASASATSIGTSASVTITVAVGADSIGMAPSGTIQLYNGVTAIGSAATLKQGYSSTTGLVQSTASISLTGSQLAAIKAAKLDHPVFPWQIYGGTAAMACVFFLAVPVRRRNWCNFLALAAAVMIISYMAACGGGRNSSNGSEGSGGNSSGSSTIANITAQYSGDTNYTGSTSSAITITVTQ
jgi:hypothetical protein